MAFFGIFSLAFGIANQKLAHPEEQFHSGMFWQLLKRGLWEIFGEIDDPLKNGTKKKGQRQSEETYFQMVTKEI
jgi:hypothetical protein